MKFKLNSNQEKLAKTTIGAPVPLRLCHMRARAPCALSWLHACFFDNSIFWKRCSFFNSQLSCSYPQASLEKKRNTFSKIICVHGWPRQTNTYRKYIWLGMKIKFIKYKTRLSKDNGPASEKPNETHNKCMWLFHKLYKFLWNKKKSDQNQGGCI